MKRPVSGAKMQVQYVTLVRFCYIDIGLFQVRIAVVHNSNIQGMLIKRNALTCWNLEISPTPTLNLPDSVKKCKSDIKNVFVDAAVLLKLSLQILAVLLNRSFRGFVLKLFITSATLYHVSYRASLL